MRKFRKGLLAVLTAGLLATTAFGIAACDGGGEKQQPDTPETPQEATVYTVKFETNGGTLLPEQGANPGDKAVKPGDPKKAGYTFGGWYTNAACTTEYDFGSAVNGNTTIYAKWNAAPTTDAGYFRLTQDGEGWSVAAKPGMNMPVDVVIPSKIDDKTITSVAISGFEDVGNVQSVTLPDTVTSIGKRAFRNCSDLTVVLGGANVETIDSDAFDNTVWDNNLPAGEVYLGKTLYKYASSIFVETAIDVKEGTVGIAAGAFLDQPNLVGVTFPEGLKYIGSYAFGASEEGTANGVTEVILPDSVVEVGAAAFCYAPIETLVIGTGMEYIGAKAFANSNVTYLEYNAPKGVIADATFTGLTAPATVKVADTVKEFPVNLFKGWEGLVSADLGTGITVIPANAFDGLANLAEVKFGAITRVGNNAFRGIAVPELTLPSTLTRIGASAFANNSALKKVTYDAVDATAPDSYFAAFKGCGNLKEVVIGDNVKNIPNRLFYCQDSVTKLTLGSKVEKIGYQSFYGTGLEGKLVLPSSLVELGDSAFASADDSAAEVFGSMNEMRITKVTVPETLERLGSNAFGNNNYLTTVDWNALHVENFAYSERVNSAGTFYSAFNGCKSLKNVTLSTKLYHEVTELPAQFLQGCTAVEAIDLNRVTSIGANAFDGCTKLTDVGTNNFSQLTALGADGLKGTAWYNELIKTEGDIYIGKILVGYSGTMPDDYNLNIKYGTTTVADSAFSNKSKLTSITFPASVTTIGTNAFYSCTGLTELNLTSSYITSIGNSAFAYCSKLAEIKWGTRLETIGNSAFQKCPLTNMLDDFQIPKSVTSIGNNAFRDAKITGKLSVEEGSTLEKMPNYGFYSATPTEIDLPENVTTLDSLWCGSNSNSWKGSGDTGADNFAATNGLYNVKKISIPGVTTLGGFALACLPEETQSQIDLSKITSFGTSSLYNWRAETVTFSEGTTFTGGEVFSKDHNNKSFKLGNRFVKHIVFKGPIEEIPELTFFRMTALEDVTFKDAAALKTVGNNAFQDAGSKEKGLKIDISHVTYFGEYAFNGSYILPPEGGNLVFDDNLSYIGPYAFDTCLKLSGELVLGQKLQSLPRNSFCNPCFEKVTIKGNIKSIGQVSFATNAEINRKTNLKEVVIEDGVEIFDGHVFSTVAGSEITLPASMTALDDLTTFAVVHLNGYLEPSDLSENTFSKSAALHIDNADTLKKYEDGAIWEAYRNQFVGPDGVKGGWYLNGEGKLLQYKGSKTEIVIPKEVTAFSIGQILTTQAEYQADKTFTLEQGNTNYKLDAAKKMLTSADGKTLYYYYGSDAAFTSDTIETVMAYAFAYSTTLKTLTLPKATSLGANMLLGTSVTGITVDSVSEVGASAFKGLTTLESFSAAKATKVGESAFDGCTALATVTLPKVTEVGASAFNKTLITKESLAFDNLTSIGNSAFSSCKKIEGDVDISAATTIGTGIFSSCSEITTVKLNSAITAIPNNMFSYCTNLTSVTGPTAITEIGQSAFSSCKNITIDLSKVTNIGQQAFNSGALKDIDLTSVVTIGQYAFNGCPLETIKIGDKCTSIGSYAFTPSSGKATYTLTITAPVPPTLSSNALHKMFQFDGSIKVPSELVDTYKKASGWKDDANYISAIEAE